MEFFYTDNDGTEQGPFTERQMTDWIREYPDSFGEERKISFNKNGRDYNTTLARMRARNGLKTPFIFAKCDRVDKEKELMKEIEEASTETKRIDHMIEEFKKSMSKTSAQSRQLLERLQLKVDAAVANAERLKKEATENVAADAAAAATFGTQAVITVAPTVNSTVTRVLPTEPTKTTKRHLPLYDVSMTNEDDMMDKDRDAIKIFRDFLDDIDMYAAQKKLKFPICDKCRGCDGKPVSENNLRAWLCHITSKNHVDKFRQRGGRVTQQCLDWYAVELAHFPKTRIKVKEDEAGGNKEMIEEEKVDLEKKKLESHGGVIMLPVLIPLLHLDPSDTTKLSLITGRKEMEKLRRLVFDRTDRYSAAKSLHLPATKCDVCNEKFCYAPMLVPHLFSNKHIEKYMAKRGSYSQHDFDFWTEICNLFPEAGRDKQNNAEVRGKLRAMGRSLDVSACKDSFHYSIYGGEDRRRHVLDFVKKNLIEHHRPVVVYLKSEEMAIEFIDHLKEELPETRIGYATSAEECAELEVMVSDCTLRLTRPHSIAFLSGPMDARQKADYAQKLCGEFVESNLIVALEFDEQNELRKFSKRVIAPPPTVSSPPQSPASEPPTVPPTVAPPVHTVPPPAPPPVHVSPPRVAPPVASVPPTPQTSSSYPTVPPSQRKYDPKPSDQSPQTPGESKKSNCAMM